MKDAIVLGMVIYVPINPSTCEPAEILLAKDFMESVNLFLDMFVYGEYSSYSWAKMNREGTLPEMKEGDLELFKENTVDWLSFSYYMSFISQYENNHSTPQLAQNPYLEQSEWGWAIDPIGFRTSLREIYERYRLPVMVVENGYGMREELTNETVDDEQRIVYMRDHIEQMSLAIEEGVDCRGYLAWGPIDILSSKGEMSKRYGFIYVNREDKDLKDMNRYKKKSFNWFKKVIATNGEDLS